MLPVPEHPYWPVGPGAGVRSSPGPVSVFSGGHRVWGGGKATFFSCLPFSPAPLRGAPQHPAALLQKPLVGGPDVIPAGDGTQTSRRLSSVTKITRGVPCPVGTVNFVIRK